MVLLKYLFCLCGCLWPVNCCYKIYRVQQEVLFACVLVYKHFHSLGSQKQAFTFVSAQTFNITGQNYHWHMLEICMFTWCQRRAQGSPLGGGGKVHHGTPLFLGD